MPSSMPVGQTVGFTLLIVALVVVRFLARELRVRRMRLSMLFLIPAILAAFAVWLCYLVITRAPQFTGELALEALGALVVGGAIGFAVAHFTSVQSGGPGVAVVRGSWITVAIWVGALILRYIGRFAFASRDLDTQLLLNAGIVLLLMFATGVVRLRILQRRRALPD